MRSDAITENRAICSVEGCSNVVRNKGFQSGRRRYDSVCQRHHKLSMLNSEGQLTIDNSACEKCGWNLAPCDRHRINPTGPYTRENVKVLCPNCHRLKHYTLLRQSGPSITASVAQQPDSKRMAEYPCRSGVTYRIRRPCGNGKPEEN